MGLGKLSNELRPAIIVMFFGFLGLIVALIQEIMVDAGYLLDEFIQESITLPDLQIVTIIFALLVGCIVAIIWGS